MSRGLRGALAAACVASVAGAQTTFVEVEPNALKSEATPVSCLAPGDAITGSTTGGVVVAGDTTSVSADTFLVQSCSAPAGIYRHELALSSAITLHTCTLRGVVQDGTVGVGGMPTSIDATVSTAAASAGGELVSTWYGFGGGEELYWRVRGLPSTTQPYSASLSSTPVAPVFVGTFLAGSITISCVDQGHASDTDLWLYDASFAAIALAGNDDAQQSNVVQSRLTRTLAAGTYYVAISGYNLANDRPSPADDDFVQGHLLDLPGAVATNSALPALNVSFAISDSARSVPVAAQINVGRVHEIGWYRFDVAATDFESFCAGDGTQPVACPCGNNGGTGRGCANSFAPQGAWLTASGTTNPDTVVLTCSEMPTFAYCVFLKGNVETLGTPFGDGVRCADGTLIRLRFRLSNLGVSSYPQPGDPPLSVRGLTPPGSGALGVYQTYYRNAAAMFCPPQTFNVSNGWRVIW